MVVIEYSAAVRNNFLLGFRLVELASNVILQCAQGPECHSEQQVS